MPEAPSQSEPPPQSEPKSRTGLRIAIGAVVALIALAIVGIIGRLTFLRNEFDLTTLIDDSAGIAPSSPVLLNGIDVGHVVRVTLSGSPDPNKTVRVLMRFPRRIMREIPEDSTASITAANLLGDKYLNISRGTHSKHIEPGADMPSTPTEDIGIVLSRANVPLNQLNDLLAKIDRIYSGVTKEQGTLGKLLNGNSALQQHVTSATGTGNQLVQNVQRGQGALNRFTELQQEVQKPLARLTAIEADLSGAKGSLGRFLNDPYTPTLTAEANQTMAEAKGLIDGFNAGNRTTEVMNRIQQVSNKLEDTVARLESGQGTAGQIMINSQLLDSLRKANRELNSLTADIEKHPTHFAAIRFGLF